MAICPFLNMWGFFPDLYIYEYKFYIVFFPSLFFFLFFFINLLFKAVHYSRLTEETPFN